MSLSLVQRSLCLRDRAISSGRAKVASLLTLSLLCLSACGAQAATFTVNTTSSAKDGVCSTMAGGCSLPDAITASTANGSTSPDTIAFNVPATDAGYNASTGVFTIKVTTALPTLTQGLVTIDGATQTAFTGNTNVYGPEIEISSRASLSTGLLLSSGSNSVKNLMVNGFGTQIEANGNSNIIEGCYIGVDATGTGPAAANDRYTTYYTGIYANDQSNTVIGGDTAAKGNLIGYGQTGINLEYCANSTVQYNTIRNQTSAGVVIYGCTNTPVTFNTISKVVGVGVKIYNGGSGNTVRQNSIYGTTLRGIDLNNDGVTANDLGDGDSGANLTQNFPVITAATSSGNNTTVQLSLNSAANTAFTIDVYRSNSTEILPHGFGPGRTWVGQTTLNTDSGGNGTASLVVAGVNADNWFTATATSGNNTSEFSFARQTNGLSGAVVTNTNDTGPGSLRNALFFVNYSGASNGITFQIPTSDGGYNSATGVFTITAATLPTLLRSGISIDGATQTAFTGNTNTRGPEVEITAGASIGKGLLIQGDGNSVKNLMVNGFGTQIEANGNSNIIEGCYIGVDATGTGPAAANDRYTTYYTGIYANDQSNTVIGGDTAAKGNLIGYGQTGINLEYCANSTVQYNTIRNQTSAGVVIYGCTNTPVTFNTISKVVGVGVKIYNGGSGNTVRQNSIYGNTGLGIDLNNDGVTVNDVGDGDSDSNLSQNFPVITAVTTSGANTTVQLTLNSAANTTFTVDVYRSGSAEILPVGFGPGRTWVGQTTLNTDSGGNGTASLVVAGVNADNWFTATATNGNNTSEFSFARQTNGLSGAVVTNTNDTGPGSLRNAIRFVNVTRGATAITFNIPTTDMGYNSATGVSTITLLTALPVLISGGVTIDGATQTAFAGNTNLYGPEVEITAGASISDGFLISSVGNILRNLQIDGFGNNININGNNTTIESCYIGVDWTGTEQADNNDWYTTYYNAIYSNNHSNIVIGGDTAAKGNVIGYGQNGLDLEYCSNSSIQYNEILGQTNTGAFIYGCTNSSLIFNRLYWIDGPAIVIYNGGSGNLVRQNTMFSNTGLGIDLENDGVTGNDVGDSDTGSNQRQNFPVLTSATATGSNTVVQFDLNSGPNAVYTIDVYRTPTNEILTSGYGPGAVWVGQTTVTTDSVGNATGSVTVPGIFANSSYVATASNGNNTSEFSGAQETGVVDGAPSVGSATPALGTSTTGTARTITVTYSDPNGATDIAVARLLVAANSSSVSGALYGSYDAVANKLYLYDDAGTTLLGGFAPGSSNIISNSQGSLNCAATTVARSGNSLTVNWNFTPKYPFAATKNLYGWVSDKGGLANGLIQIGTWKILNAPANGSVTPASGSSGTGVQRILTATYIDGDGASDLSAVRLLVNGTLVTNNGLYGYYDVAANKLYLQNDAATASLGGFAPGSANVISNSQGSLNCAATTVTISGNTITVNWAFTPNATFKGAKNLYLRATDKASNNSPWEAKGSWNISNVPTNGSVTPASGSSNTGVQRILTATYSDVDGTNDLSAVRLLVNGTLATNNALYGYYDVVANKLYLQNDAGAALLGGFTPGTANVITNSQGSLNCQATTVSVSGNTITVNWAFTPNATFKGAKNLYLRATDKAGNNSAWEAKGTWTISALAGVQKPSQSSSFGSSANNS